MTDKEKLFEEIQKKSNSKYTDSSDDFKYGQFVRIGLIQGKPFDFDHCVGFLVQIRKKRGAYGSDQYIIRHSNGKLMTHSNQMFWKISDTLIEDIVKFFPHTPEEEFEGNEEIEYNIEGEKPEKGFLIEYKEGDPREDSPHFTMSITTFKQ